MSTPYDSITVADYNHKAGYQPYAISGIISPNGRTYCTKCADHVLVYRLDPEVRVIFKDQDICTVCDSCFVSICNCQIPVEDN